MTEKSPLSDKLILLVDDEPDVLETAGEILHMCRIHKAQDYESAIQYLVGYSYDVVILDIMGVDGFELLRTAVESGFPTVMLTAHALTPESLKKSIKLGAVSFVPKDELPKLKEHIEDVILGEGKPVWGKLFRKLEGLFNKRFGPDWKKRDKFFKEFEETLKSSAT